MLQSLGCQQPSDALKDGTIIDLRPANTSSQDDDTEYAQTLLAESRDAAIETYGAGSFCVGNVADDPDVEDVAVVMDKDDITRAWEQMTKALQLDLSSVSEEQPLEAFISSSVH